MLKPSRPYVFVSLEGSNQTRKFDILHLTKYDETVRILYVKTFILTFLILGGCNYFITPNHDVESLDFSSCPKKWTDKLNNRPNCKTSEFWEMKSSTCYKNGKRDGLQCSYTETGDLYSETNWKNGEKDGTAIDYYENGNIKRIRTLKNHEMQGGAKAFYPSGNLMFDGYYNGFCDVKYGTCYTESGIAVPLSDNDLTNCYNKCADIIERELGTSINN